MYIFTLITIFNKNQISEKNDNNVHYNQEIKLIFANSEFSVNLFMYLFFIPIFLSFTFLVP